MSNPFADYGKRATSTTPDRLVGVHKTRADAKARYAEIVVELSDFSDPENLEIYLMQIAKEIAQYRAELPFLWFGDGATPDRSSLATGDGAECGFLGLAKEIERAQARVDDGLDFPRWDPGQFGNSEKGLEL